MLSKKIFFLLFISVLVNGCGLLSGLSDVIPDNRNKYQKSQSLPDLEVPPDLTSEALDDPLLIPGEENAKTLSEFQRRKNMQQGEQALDSETAMLGNIDEKYLLVQGTTSSVWPKLREFWLAKGFEIALDDAELGVMETQFKGILAEGATANREKFKILSEDSEVHGSLILFISSETQKKIMLDDSSAEWISEAIDEERLEEIIDELNVHFYGTSKVYSSSGSKQAIKPKSLIQRAEIFNAGEGREYLTVPDEFSKAWHNIEDIINELGMQIEKQDVEKGVYFIIYDIISDKEDKGLLSKLKFWGNDKEAQEFRISLTGVGDKTEVILLDKKDQWKESERASRILSLIQNQYNKLPR